MAKLNSASPLFLNIVLHDMMCVTCFVQPQIWVTCAVCSQNNFICCQGRCIHGVYILYYNKNLTLSISLHRQVLYPNDGLSLVSETSQAIFLTIITSKLSVYEDISQF